VFIEFHPMLLAFVFLEVDDAILVLQVWRLVVQGPLELGLALLVRRGAGASLLRLA